MICVDSDVIIDFLNKKKEAVEVLQQYEGEDDLVATEINVFEVSYGVYKQKQINKQEELSAKMFFERVHVFSLQSGWGIKAAQFLASLRRRGKEIEEKDCFILGIMAVHGCNKIITRNVKHYSSILGIQVISY